MARKKWGIEFDGITELAGRIDKAGGSAKLKTAVDDALKKSKDYVNGQLDTLIVPGNMPAKGKYWTGRTQRAINRERAVEWDGNVASIGIGFTFKEAPEAIYLIYGTPKTSKVRGLETLLTRGGAHKKAVGDIQQEAFNEVIKEIGG